MYWIMSCLLDDALENTSDDKVNEYYQIGKHYYLFFYIKEYSDIHHITCQISIDRIYNLIGKEFKLFPVYIKYKLHHQKINAVNGIGTIFLKLPADVLDMEYYDINQYILENVIYKCYKKKYLETHKIKVNTISFMSRIDIFIDDVDAGKTYSIELRKI